MKVNQVNAREEELQIEVERLRSWLLKISTEVSKETPAEIIEAMADKAIEHSSCACHPKWGATQAWAALGEWPPKTKEQLQQLVADGSLVRPMVGDLAKRFADIDGTFFNHVRRMDNFANRFADIDGTLTALRRDINSALNGVKQMADIDGTLIALRRDINFALDRLGFLPWQPDTPATIHDTPDDPAH